MERQILVPLDGSPLAEQALPHAVALARATRRPLLLVRVVPGAAGVEAYTWPAAVPAVAVLDPEIERKAACEYLRATAALLGERSGLTVTTRTLEGDPAAQIVGQAQRPGDAAVIVMATHGRSGMSRWFYGSVAERVLQTAHAPILLIHARPEAAVTLPSYRTILVPLDGSAFAAQALAPARDLARALGATVLLATVTPGADDVGLAEAGQAPMWALADARLAGLRAEQAMHETVEWLAAEGVETRAIACHGIPTEELIRLIAAEQVDLVVMATHARGLLQRLWRGSVALNLVQAGVAPTLLMHAREPADPAQASVFAGTGAALLGAP
jgi:nucleotide-binding universal stress UspA family protein